MDRTKLSETARQDAEALTCAGSVRAQALCRRGAHALTALRHRRERLAADADSASQWLLDNWYLAEREARDALQTLRHAHALRAAGEVSLPEACCARYLAACGGEVSLSGLEAYLTGFQEVIPLRSRELAALIPTLKLTIVTRLAALYLDEDARRGASAEAGRLFASLRLLATAELGTMLERVDPIEQCLRRERAGVYGEMDQKSRAYYRRTLEKRAHRARTPTPELARALVERADREGKHVGALLFDQTPPTGAWYITAVLLLTLFGAVLCGFLTDSLSCAVLLSLPLSELVKSAMDAVLLRLTPPRFVPRMELKNGVPRNGRTLCVIPALLSKPEDGVTLAGRLEEFHLCNREAGKNLAFGLLADLPEGKTEHAEGDAEILRAAKAAVDALNAQYGGGLYLFARKRSHAPEDNIWRGHERKRGALLDLAHLLRGMETGVHCLAGKPGAQHGVRYLITLDADTFLSPGTAKELIGAMLHPLSTPVIDHRRGAVTAGYGLMHPRMTVELESAVRTDFARIYAGQGGTDPYGIHCSELYMDRYDCGGFAGKGILDIDALLDCCDRAVPENRVLSHDALEGAYLRGGYLGDVELTDSFPASGAGYFARMERWVRGDWQNLPWLFRRGKHFRAMDRWRLFDSLRRSLVPPATFLAIFLGLWLRWPGLRLAALAALLSLMSRLLLSLGDAMLRPETDRRVKYHSTILSGAAGALVQTAVQLWLLPWEAWVCASAIVRALWRMGISHRKLLQWQTAAQSGGGRATLPLSFRRMLPATVLGAALMLLSPGAAGKTVGLLWALSPAAAWLLGRERRKRRALSPTDRARLLEYAAETWHYFAALCTAEDHFLPPDNRQENPPAGAAHRTSPTNISFALMSALCARALSLKEGDPEALIEGILTTLEGMEKWNGHLYNWYQTISLRVMEPAYISTVDSGNLAAGLLAVWGALKEERPELASRARALYDAMDFSPLYDPARRLMRIGIDAHTLEPSPGWYDLMSSEARLTAYLAIAKGDVPRRLWRQLSRAQVQKDGYRGMASWTGTMFEYLMPELFLPMYRESLLWESAKFCLYCQRRRTSPGLPWGISESGYFALDQQLHYRYKAHGVAALALRRGMDEELVLSPYSAFLALLVEPRAAMRDLRRFEALGMRSAFGFYEAVDFTPRRTRGAGGEIVRAGMAHHLGMSLVAACTVLRGGLPQEWIMKDPSARAYRGFLAERVPIGGVVIRRRPRSPVARRARTEPLHYLRTGDGTDALAPACCLLSNGAYHVRFAETGAAWSRIKDCSLFGDTPPAVRLVSGDGMHTLFPRTGAGAAQWRFTESTASVTAPDGPVAATLSVAVSAQETGELRILELTAREAFTGAAELVFSPVLAPGDAARSHPAFWRLGVEEKARGGTLLYRRLARGEVPERYLALALDRAPEALPEKPHWLYDGRVTVRVPLRLETGERATLRFAFGVGAHEQDAFQAAQQTLAMPRSAFSDLSARFAAQCGMDAPELAAAMALTGPLSAGRFTPHAESALRSRDALWRCGVSGDRPILAAPLTRAEHRSAAELLVRRHALLSRCGLESDLVFCIEPDGDYYQTGRQTVTQALRALDLEAALHAPGGVFFSEDTETIRANAAVWADPAADDTPPRSTLPIVMSTKDRRDLACETPPVQYAADGSIAFTMERALPRRAWAQVLTNGRLGFFAADSGCGAMWYQNAHLGRITPWRNDPWAVSGPERLERLGSARQSLFADSENTVRAVYGFGAAAWQSDDVRVTAFIPWEDDVRVLLLENTGAAADVQWTFPLQLAERAADASAVVTSERDGLFCASSPRSAVPMTVRAAVSEPVHAFTCDLNHALRSQLDGTMSAGAPGCFCLTFTLKSAAVIVVGTAEADVLRRYADVSHARDALLAVRSHWQGLVQRVHTALPDTAMERYLNGWAAYQAMACRLLARTSLYQSGGAFGFRDQLQDSVNLLHFTSAPARAQILACCAHQFPDGDVCHWWHTGGTEERGVRTRISDDLVWLPWAVCEYVEKTGDRSLLAEEASYLEAAPLAERERARYDVLHWGSRSGTVLDHCLRALECVITRGTGAHGLLLLLDGDWNDALDRAGHGGRGESVWLTWFFAHTAHRMAALLTALQSRRGAALQRAAERLGQAAENAWDGSWYLRGYYDDGTPIGAHDSEACRIDAIAQSFSALVPEAAPDHVETALNSALDALYDGAGTPVRLFTPPYRAQKPDPGYLRSYGPGFRENGGQYTHGAIWLAMALLRTGHAAEGAELLRAVLPASFDPDRYEAEPYVLAADVYAGDEQGRAGWSWYTGAAGWYLRVALEDLLGLKLRGGRLFIRPNLPPDWEGCSVQWRRDGETYTITLSQNEITVNGMPYDGGAVG